MDATRLNLRHLGAVVAIHRLGSVGAAAAAANLTQPAVTQGLAKLERQLGVTLFTRTPRGMAPTAAAAIFAPRVATALGRIASPRVTMAQLAAFVAVARAGSYAVAGAATGLAAPSLHRAVRDLSLALGRTLVDRRGRGLVLTEAGRRTARRFRLALADLAAGLAEVAALIGRPGGRIAIGAMPLARARLLPAVVAAFHRAHPTVEIVIAEGSHAELIEPLRDAELDLLIGALRDPAPGSDVVQTGLFTDRPVVIGRPGHPLAATLPGIADLARFGWIVPARGTPLRTMWTRMFAAADVAAPPVPIECGSVIAIRGLLLDSDFLTLLSPDQVAVELAAGWLVALGPPPGMVRTIGLTTRRDWSPTSDQSAFVRLAAATAAAIYHPSQNLMRRRRMRLAPCRGRRARCGMAFALSLIGFGEAAQTFADGAGWAARGFDIADRSAEFARLAVHQSADMPATVSASTVILCLVTPAAALLAAQTAARDLAPGTLWLDLNSVAPATKRAAAAAIAAAGSRYVDGAIMAPVRPAARGVPVLLAGPHAEAGRAALAAVGFTDLRVVAGPVGSAAAIKMIRSVMVKGREAVTAECLAAAHRAGVVDEVLASLGDGAAAAADYDLDRMLVHGRRRADELGEVAATLADLGIAPALSRAAAGWQRALGRGSAPAGLAAKLGLIATCHTLATV